MATFRPERFLAYLDHEREFVVDARGVPITAWQGESLLTPRAVRLRALRIWPMGS